MTWPRAAELLAADGGPAELITRTRRAEAADPLGSRWPRGEAHDDATVAVMTHRRPRAAIGG